MNTSTLLKSALSISVALLGAACSGPHSGLSNDVHSGQRLVAAVVDWGKVGDPSDQVVKRLKDAGAVQVFLPYEGVTVGPHPVVDPNGQTNWVTGPSTDMKFFEVTLQGKRRRIGIAVTTNTVGFISDDEDLVGRPAPRE